MKITRGGFKYKSLHDKQNGNNKLLKESINAAAIQTKATANTQEVCIRKCQKSVTLENVW